MSRTKYWMFTLFGEEPDTAAPLALPAGAVFLVYQRETAPTTGKLHYQCYIEFKEIKRLTALKKIFPSAHWDNRKGTKEEAIHYVTKPHDGCDCKHCVDARAGPDAPVGRSLPPVRLGTPTDERTGPKKPDIKDILKLRDGGATRREMIANYPAIYQRYRNTLADYEATSRPPEKPRTVVFCYGPPRMGKTYWARHNWPLSYMVPPPKAGAVWFTGYENEPVVIFDEYSGQLSLDEWKNYTDVYPLQAHTKGGFSWYNPDVVVITSNTLPGDWYIKKTKRQDASEKDRSVDLAAMEDRIHQWHYWAASQYPEPPRPVYRTQPFPGWIYHAPTNPNYVAPPLPLYPIFPPAPLPPASPQPWSPTVHGPLKPVSIPDVEDSLHYPPAEQLAAVREHNAKVRKRKRDTDGDYEPEDQVDDDL